MTRESISDRVARDMRTKRLFDAARFALAAMLDDDDALQVLRHHEQGLAVMLIEKLEQRSKNIQAVWD